MAFNKEVAEGIAKERANSYKVEVSEKRYDFFKKQKTGSLFAYQLYFALKKGTMFLVHTKTKRENIRFVVTGSYCSLANGNDYSIEIKKLKEEV